jgi:hypothetical protein
MIFATLLRALCLSYAAFLIIVSIAVALLASGMPQGEPITPWWEIISIVVGVATVLSSGFIYSGLLGERGHSATMHRFAAAVLLAVPIILGAFLVLRDSHPEMRPFGWVFLAPAAVAFIGFAWPGLALPSSPPTKTSE